ncbi:MAG: hypothetical protein MN733_15760, partial [Nitrososphaera sp.]|nr:hypothetical protein [Nitrososphaera sp.]
TLTDGTPHTSKIAHIARKYIEVLPHVRYTAVGHNFRGFVDYANAEVFLKERFLKTGPWDSEKRSLEGFGLKFAYLLETGRISLSLDSAAIVDRSIDSTKESKGVLVHANYHRDCQNYPTNEQVIQHLGHVMEDCNHFREAVAEILE